MKKLFGCIMALTMVQAVHGMLPSKALDISKKSQLVGAQLFTFVKPVLDLVQWNGRYLCEKPLQGIALNTALVYAAYCIKKETNNRVTRFIRSVKRTIRETTNTLVKAAKFTATVGAVSLAAVGAYKVLARLKAA